MKICRNFRRFSAEVTSRKKVIFDNPYTQKHMGEISFLSHKEIEEKLSLADDAFKENGRRSIHQRQDLVKQLIKYL